MIVCTTSLSFLYSPSCIPVSYDETKDSQLTMLPDDEPRYERDRSASPRPKRDDDYPMKRDDNYRGGRDRSASPNGRMDSRYADQQSQV